MVDALRSGRSDRKVMGVQVPSPAPERMAYVYILKSELNGIYYIGSTRDLARRLCEHNRGQTASTKNLRPWVCVFSHKTEKATARAIEKKLKSYKSRVIIDRIVSEGEINFMRE